MQNFEQPAIIDLFDHTEQWKQYAILTFCEISNCCGELTMVSKQWLLGSS